MDKDATKLAILTESAKCGNQIYKVKDDFGEFVKLKHSYSQPEDVRSNYLIALSSLLNSGLVRQVFASDDIALYEVTAQGKALTTLASAKERIKNELQVSGHVFKIHSRKGEFVQCGEESLDKIDSERILYLQALHMLLHHGAIRVASESKEMTTYELDLTNQLYCDQHTLKESTTPKFAA